MKKLLAINKIRFTFIAAFVFIGIFVFTTYSNMRRVEQESRNVKSALDVLLCMENILGDIRAIETGQRGFTISGDEKFLSSYDSGLHHIRRDTTILAQLKLADSTNAVERTQLLEIVNKKIAYSKKLVEARRVFGFDSTVNMIKAAEGLSLMNEITARVNNIENKDRILLQQSNIHREQYARRTTMEFFILAILFYCLLGYSFITILRDFKEQEKSSRILRFNSSLIANISDPIITTDANFKITNWNQYAEELYGYSESEVLGRSISDVLKTEYLHVSLPEIMEEFARKDYWKGEVIHYHKNGIPLDVEVSTSAIRNQAGGEGGTVAVIRDITSRKKLEAQLHTLTENLQQQVNAKAAELTYVFERITDAFIALDSNWNYTYLNKKAAELHGKKVEELLGKNIWDEFPDVVDEPFYAALRRAQETQVAQRLQLFHSTTGRWYEDLIYPSSDGISVYYHDITERKKAELALEKVHERLNYHINNTPMGVIEFDNEMAIIQWNEQAESIFGWQASAVLQRSIDDINLVSEEDKGLVKSAIKTLLTDELTNNVVHNRNITKEGKLIYCEWYNSVFRDDDGKPIGVMSIVQDVTARRTIELELQEAESKFRNLVEESMVGVYIIQDEKLVYVNPCFAETFGYHGDAINENFPPETIVHPDDRPRVLEHIRSRIEGKYRSMNYEFTGIHRDGSLLYLEVFGTFTLYRGKPAIIGTLINITEKKKSVALLEFSEHALKISNERFSLVAEATNEAIWDWDLDNDQIWGNESFRRIFNLTEGELLNYESFLAVVHPDDREKIVTNYEAAIRGNQKFVTEEFRLQDKDGDYKNIYDRAYILYDGQQRAFRMLGAMQDITEEKEFEQQLIVEKELSDSVINSLPGVFYLYNKQGQFYRWNKNFETVTGYSAEEIAGLHPLDLFTGTDKELLRSKINSVFTNGEDQVEAMFIAKDGSGLPYFFTGRVIRYEGEDCLLGVGIDISERVRSQEKLQQSEEKFRTLIEQASDGIFISNREGQYLDVNSSATILTGYRKEELLRLSISDIICKTDEEDNPLMMDELLSGHVIINERVIKQKNGNLINVEISAKLLPDGRYQGIVRDITARKKAEEALRLSEIKYRLLFNQNPMPMFMISVPERRFLDVNPAALSFYGYSRAEFLQMDAYAIRSEEEAKKLRYYLKANGKGINDAGIWEHRTKDGRLVKVNIITHNIIYEGESARLVLAIDVTEKLEAEENLKKSHEDLRQLATHLEQIRESERTHMAREIHDELGQQLTGLKMDISWLNKKIKSDDQEVKDKIRDTIQLIDKTVITVRRIATQLRPSILDDLGLVAAMEWQSDEFEKRSEITTIFKSNAPNVTVDSEVATGLFRIYQESLTNVLRHAAATKVNAELKLGEKSLELVIKDNGVGFNTDDIEHKKTLGLLGMKERSLLMGGQYEIKGKPGKGTCVRIIVPLKPD
ncbi:MAG: domain S-box protein [Ferruginibacter sp.]|nr:domain S-box protein [Ferruginibacter sp.]